jgi:hypothetical protein
MRARILAVAVALAVTGLVEAERAATQTPDRAGSRGAAAATAKKAGTIPRTADRKPDMNGIFSAADGGGRRREPIAFQPWAQQKHDLFVSRRLADNPTARCLSPGLINLTTVSFFPIQFVQTPGQMVILYEWDHFFRVIPTDGRKQTDDPDPLQSLGHSVGKWDGDTLVVDVVGLSDYTWIDNNAGVHSDALHIAERFTMIDKDTIEYKAMLDDPKAWTKPWNVAALLKRRPQGDALMEYNCTENNKPEDYPSRDDLVR